MSATIEHVTSQALLERVQRRWVALLRRATAREAATRRALTHARTLEAARCQELSTLRQRLHGLEQVLFEHAVSRRAATPTPLLMPAAPAPRPVSAPFAPAASTPFDPVASTPFDPVALVAAMLPLEPQLDAIDVNEALSRLRSTGQPTSTERQSPAVPIAETDILAATDVDATDAESDLSIWPTEGGAWFPRALRRLVAEDAQAAGRLLLQLLPAQGLVWPEDVAYTLDIADTGCLNVVVSGDTTTVSPLLALDPVHTPVLRADLAGLARAVTARRGWGRIGARLSGSRGRLRPLHALACAPLGLRDLERQGVRPDPTLLLRLLALGIDPEWTAGRELTVGFHCPDLPRASCFIHVSGSAPVAVTSTPPLGRVTGTLTCRADGLLGLLLDNSQRASSLGAGFSGDVDAVHELLRWLRAVDAAVVEPGMALAA